MAVTGLSRRGLWACLVLFAAVIMPARADDSADVHQVVGAVAEALSSGDAALAIDSFSKSCADYDKIRDDFSALTAAYSVQNQIEFTDEDVSATAASVSVHWAMTLTPVQGTSPQNRSADLVVKLAREGKHWRIKSVSPLTIFDP